jgi:hypothetical protein
MVGFEEQLAFCPKTTGSLGERLLRNRQPRPRYCLPKEPRRDKNQRLERKLTVFMQVLRYLACHLIIDQIHILGLLEMSKQSGSSQQDVVPMQKLNLQHPIVDIGTRLAGLLIALSAIRAALVGLGIGLVGLLALFATGVGLAGLLIALFALGVALGDIGILIAA